MLQSIISRHQHELPRTTRPQAHAAVNFEGGQWQKLNNFLRTEQQAFGALSLCSTQTTCRTARRCFSRFSAAAAVAQVFVSPCCLSCSDGSVAVTGHLLCCTFLSWRLSLSRPPTGLCHVAPTFVQDSLHVTKKPTGWPLFNHCLCRTDQEGTSIGRENGKWLSFTPRFPCSGWSHLHLCLVHFKYGLFKCSTLNGSWQGQGLVSQAPNLPTAELLWLGPPALCTAAASTTAAST